MTSREHLVFPDPARVKVQNHRQTVDGRSPRGGRTQRLSSDAILRLQSAAGNQTARHAVNVGASSSAIVRRYPDDKALATAIAQWQTLLAELRRSQDRDSFFASEAFLGFMCDLQECRLDQNDPTPDGTKRLAEAVVEDLVDFVQVSADAAGWANYLAPGRVQTMNMDGLSVGDDSVELAVVAHDPDDQRSADEPDADAEFVDVPLDDDLPLGNGLEEMFSPEIGPQVEQGGPLGDGPAPQTLWYERIAQGIGTGTVSSEVVNSIGISTTIPGLPSGYGIFAGALLTCAGTLQASKEAWSAERDPISGLQGLVDLVGGLTAALAAGDPTGGLVVGQISSVAWALSEVLNIAGQIQTIRSTPEQVSYGTVASLVGSLTKATGALVLAFGPAGGVATFGLTWAIMGIAIPLVAGVIKLLMICCDALNGRDAEALEQRLEEVGAQLHGAGGDAQDQ